MPGRDRLTAKTIAAIKTPGRYSDGAGLYLIVERGADDRPLKRWALLYSRGGRGANVRREIGIGPVADVSLAQAREIAGRMRAAIREGRDPRAARRPEQVPTFAAAAETYIAAMSPGWRNEKHREQWRMTLGDAYCREIRKKLVSEIGVADVLAVLRPVWSSKPETASRIRGRIEAVLDAAAAQGHRPADNPARWRGHLSKLLPARQKLSRGHHAALPWQAVPGFLAHLRANGSMSALALEWTILTASRTGEAIGAQWTEIEDDVWTVPAERMKSRRPHRVPIGPRCRAILDHLRPFGSPWVFPGAKAGRPLSNMAMLELVKPKGITVHGFRSSFRDWAAESTHYPADVVERCLAHAVESKVVAAYQRGDMLDRRREVMLAWERYCSGQSGVLIRLATG